MTATQHEMPKDGTEPADEIVMRLVSHADGDPAVVERICRDLYRTLGRRYTTPAIRRGDVQAEYLSETIAAFCNDLANIAEANADYLQTMPRRIQRKRTKGWRLPAGAVCVDRSTPWGNPYVVGMIVIFPGLPGIEYTIRDVEEAVSFYQQWLAGDTDAPLPLAGPLPPPPNREQIRAALAGHDLACWCTRGAPCHGDILLPLANVGGAP
ncbi:DUF4326 domain-containing protein [Amycolatopsis thailandensis]|uniref:DUF4326 domain-containing protein n=1 Tax=Amycolatopsis thailandensis TaxID=589330 RepID=UPI003654E92D